MQIYINGETHNFASNLTIISMLDELNIDIKRIAIEKNLEIIPKSLYKSEIINDNDKIEIVGFIGGG